MIKNISSVFFVCLSVMLALTSCLGSDDDETIYYDDTAITSFSLGTMKVRHNVKAKDGVTDSTYTTTLSAGAYRFSIDQVAKTIYNVDSLPLGTDPSAVLATLTTKNSGTVLLNLRNRSGQDSLAYYSSTDSINFTNPVRLRVYNMRMSAYREYTVTVNIHKQDGESFAWNSTSGALEGVGQRKFVALGNDTYLFGVEDGQTVGFRKNGSEWQRLSTALGNDAYKNMTAFAGNIYTLDGGNVYRSADGSDWTLVAAAPNVKQIVGASTSHLYALTESGVAYSADGATWTDDRIDDSASLLPAEDVNFICQTSAADSSVNHLIILGNRDNKTVVWSKVEENDNASSTEPWAFYSDDDYNQKTLPYLQNLQVVGYNGGLLATGGDLSLFYFSPDMGLTWDPTLTYALPSTMRGNVLPVALGCDNSNMLYFSPASSNTVLVGRLNKLGWKDSQEVFTK